MITLIGHGYVGEHIAKALNNKGVSYNWISHKDSIPKNTFKIINAAGYTGSPNVDACEIYKQETIDGNVLFPLQLEMNNPFTPIIHISSGCIYSGHKEGGWTEEDEPNFDFNNGSFYSGSKTLEQKLLQPFMNKSFLLRIRMPFGDTHHPKNFLTKMKKYDKLISYDNSLSYLPDVAAFAVALTSGTFSTGIYNVCNPGFSNAKEIVKLMGIKKEFYTEEEFKKVVVAPRSNCVLNTNKMQSVFPIRSVYEALKNAIWRLDE